MKTKTDPTPQAPVATLSDTQAAIVRALIESRDRHISEANRVQAGLAEYVKAEGRRALPAEGDGQYDVQPGHHGTLQFVWRPAPLEPSTP